MHTRLRCVVIALMLWSLAAAPGWSFDFSDLFRRLYPPTPPPPPPPATTELGMTIEGGGTANFSYFRYPNYQFGIAFVAPKTGTIEQVTIQWKSSSPSYGYSTDGTYGLYTIELQTDGPGHLPSDAPLACLQGFAGSQGIGAGRDGAFTIPLAAHVTGGEIYHLVMWNTHPDYANNWASPNVLMTGVEPWDGGATEGPRAMLREEGVWSPWTSRSNMFTDGSNYVNGSHVPVMLTWSDGTVTGDPYYSAAFSAGAYWYRANRAGQFIAWDQPSVAISRIGLFVLKRGTPGGPLLYHLEQVGGRELARGTLANAGAVSTTGTWVYAMLSAPVTLQQGQRYRLWCESPKSRNNANCYYQYVPYGDATTPAWLEGSWGGTRSYYISSTGTSWTARTTADLTFSLR